MPRPQRAKAHDVFTYFVLADFGKAGIAWVERSVNDADRKTTVADITSGQWGDVMTILECNPAENICNDVTEELLREAGGVGRAAGADRRPSRALRPRARSAQARGGVTMNVSDQRLAVARLTTYCEIIITRGLLADGQGNRTPRAGELDVQCVRHGERGERNPAQNGIAGRG